MISPSIGRVVWYYDAATPSLGQDPQAAVVAYVWNDRMINVGGFDHNGYPFRATSVQLIQDEDVPIGAHCRWMPYQKGQAAKTEALEAQAKERENPVSTAPR